MVCPQKGSKMIKASIFLLASLIMFSMATGAIAQPWQNPPTTNEEDRLINNYPNRDRVPNYYKDLQNYMRDGCKEALPGDWQRDKKGDIITITYDEKDKVFVGKVTRPVSLGYNKNHLLFKVSFPDKDWNIGVPLPSTVVSPNEPLGSSPPAKYMDINWLRQKRQCRVAQFKGIEFSFDQKTKMKTEMELWLYFFDDQFQYKVEKDVWTFTRWR